MTPLRGFLHTSVSKASTCNAGDPGSIPGYDDHLEEGVATHSSIFAREILPEEPGGLQSMGLQEWNTT